jgi:hypothetical protein
MIFRLTQKLAKKIGIGPLEYVPPDNNPFADWTAHLFTAQRTQYVILTNTPSLYSMVMYGKGITDDNRLVQSSLNYMSEFMADDGNEFLYRRLIVPHTGQILFSKATDRRVLGSINDLVFQAKFYLVEREESPFGASFLLNESPMSLLGYSTPRDAFKALRIAEMNIKNSIEDDAK